LTGKLGTTEVVEETALLVDEDDVDTEVIRVVGVILGVTEGAEEEEGDDTGSSRTGVMDG